jgi:CBS domain-containing protein
MDRTVAGVIRLDPLSRAVEALDAAGVQRLPVVDPGGRLTGVVSRDLLLAAMRARPDAPEPR